MTKEKLLTLLDLRWPEDKVRAREAQVLLSRKVRLTPLKREPRLVAGVDAAFSGDKVIGTVCVFKYPELALVEENHSVKKLAFPYIPGLLSFREGPSIAEALKGLKTTPDVILFDGQGIAHPRGIGIASFVGVILDVPTIGCAKSRLIGEFREPGKRKGSSSPLLIEGKTVGAALRTRDSTKPVFVSPGHRVSIEDSIRLVLGCTKKFRIPEPLRCADMLSKRVKKSFLHKAGSPPP